MYRLLSLIAIASAPAIPAANAADPRPAPALMRHDLKLGRCQVTALSEIVGRAAATDPTRAPETRNAFLLQIDGHRVLVGPSPAGARIRATLSALGYRPDTIDTVILTSLDDGQASGIVEGDQPAYPAATVYVDRWAADRITAQGPASPTITKALDAYRAKGHLRTPDFDLDVLPSVRMAVTSEGPRNGSVRVRCGKEMLVFWNGDLRADDRASRTAPAAIPRNRQRFLEDAVAKDYLLATTIGPFPGLGHVYRLADGFHWGSIEARTVKGTPMRRGEIYIESGADVPNEPKAPPPPK